MTNRKIPASLLLVAFCVPFLISMPSVGAEKRGGRDEVLVVGLLSDPANLNPLAVRTTQAGDIIAMMFLKLMKEEGDFLHFTPELARSWNFSPDSLAVTFHLRTDIRWGDGWPVTAEDVGFTWSVQTDTLVGWPGRHMKARISEVEVVDDSTVVFHFTARYHYMLMDANDGVIVPKHLLEDVPRRELLTCDFGRNPVGDGPYRLVEWRPGEWIELERNPRYYRAGKPKVKRIVFKIVPDMVNLVNQLKTGEIDCLESVPPDQIAALQRRQGLKLYTYPSRSMTFVSWNLTRSPFGERSLRRALAMAVDRDEIIARVWGEWARPCNSPMHPVLWAYDPSLKGIPHDRARAEEILSHLGWEDRDGDGVREREGCTLAFEMLTNYGNQQRLDVATMIQSQLAAVGVRVSIRTLEWNAFIEKILNLDYDSCVMGWKVGTRADLKEFWHSSAVGRRGFNIAGYVNAEVDDLIERARNSLSLEEARRLWYRSQRLIYEDQPFLFLAVPLEATILSARFQGVQPSPISFFANIEDWWVREGY